MCFGIPDRLTDGRTDGRTDREINTGEDWVTYRFLQVKGDVMYSTDLTPPNYVLDYLYLCVSCTAFVWPYIYESSNLSGLLLEMDFFVVSNCNSPCAPGTCNQY
jgi:hypothetical protein